MRISDIFHGSDADGYGTDLTDDRDVFCDFLCRDSDADPFQHREDDLFGDSAADDFGTGFCDKTEDEHFYAVIIGVNLLFGQPEFSVDRREEFYEYADIGCDIRSRNGNQTGGTGDNRPFCYHCFAFFADGFQILKLGRQYGFSPNESLGL